MTTAPLSFMIDRAQATVRLSGTPAPFTGSLASNISFVQFDGAKGIGDIIYNDRPALPELFTDPSPYQSAVNDWITSQAALGTNPLTLAQARAVKCALVNAIYLVKRSAPVSVTVSSTPYFWSVSDPATLAGYLYVSAVNGVISDINNQSGTFANSLATNLANFVTAMNSAESGVTGWGTVSPPSTTSFGGVSTISGPTLSLVPVGGTSPVTLASSDLANIISAINSQIATETAVNNTKQAAVNALSSISAVVSYDATTGW